MKKQILVVINPISGTRNKKNIPALVTEVLDNSKWDVTICFTERPGHATELAADAVKNGFYAVIAIGGDGTINEVAQALTGTDTALGIVPCGSGNGFGRHLHLPQQPRKALEVINKGYTEKIDYCTVNDKPFFCTSGVGFDAQVSHNFANAGSRGMTTYLRTTISTFFKYRGEPFKVTIDDQVIEKKAFVISCCNAAQYGNDAFIAPEASMQDGLIDVTILDTFNFFTGSLVGIRMLRNKLKKDRHAHFYRGKNITIERQNADAAQIDGEPLIMPEVLKFSCIHNGLTVMLDPEVSANY